MTPEQFIDDLAEDGFDFEVIDLHSQSKNKIRTKERYSYTGIVGVHLDIKMCPIMAKYKKLTGEMVGPGNVYDESVYTKVGLDQDGTMSIVEAADFKKETPLRKYMIEKLVC